MSVINIKNLTFSYDGSYDNVFENVNLTISTDWKLGLVGRNGKGKTTFLKLLTGELRHGGSIQSDVKFEYFPYPIKDNSRYVYEILQEINPDYEEWKIVRELNLLNVKNIDFFRPFNEFSGGEQTKILLAALLTRENTFLLIDEPTNHLDKAGRELLARYLNGKSAYIIVSHDKKFLDGCIDHVMSINIANIDVQSGNLSAYLENKKLRDEYEAAENQRLKSEIENLREASRRAAKWSDMVEATKYGGKQDNGLRPDRGHIGAQSAKLMKRAKAFERRMENSIEEKSKLLKNLDRTEGVSIKSADFNADTLIIVKDLQLKFGGRSINSPVSFDVVKGERISLSGANGCGKSTLIKAILGKHTEYSGEIIKSGKLKISYVSQDTSFLRGNLDEFCSEYNLNKTRLLAVLFKLGFERVQFEKNMENLSEGQRKKMLIAKSLVEDANLFIWDEPLNFIDIISRQQIREMLQGSDCSMIFVEHDADFAEEIATREIVMTGI